MEDRYSYKCVVNNKIKNVFYFYELPTNKNLVFVCTNLEDNKGHYIPKRQLLQCTGIKDRNNEFIYEGYILRDDENINWIVFWNDDSDTYSHWGLKKVENIDYYSHIKTFAALVNWKQYDIIGNIYENKHLLEKEVQSV